MIYLFFILSVLELITIIIFIWYIRKIIDNFYNFKAESENIKNIMNDFLKHVNGIYEMSVYHGDETIEGLIDHSKYVCEEIKTFQKSLSFLPEEDDYGEEGEIEIEEEERNEAHQ